MTNEGPGVQGVVDLAVAVCQHDWRLYMIEMPQGYAKPGATRCTKCGAYKEPDTVLTFTCTACSARDQALAALVAKFKGYRDAPMHNDGDYGRKGSKIERATIRKTLNVVIVELAAMLSEPATTARVTETADAGGVR